MLPHHCLGNSLPEAVYEIAMKLTLDYQWKYLWFQEFKNFKDIALMKSLQCHENLIWRHLHGPWNNPWYTMNKFHGIFHWSDLTFHWNIIDVLWHTCLLVIMRLVFGWYYFVGQAYFFSSLPWTTIVVRDTSNPFPNPNSNPRGWHS